MSGVLTRRGVSESGVAVRYTPCAKTERVDEDLPGEEEEEEDLQEEISILRHPHDDAPTGRPLARGHLPGRLKSTSSVSVGSGSGSGSGSVGRFRIGIANRATDDLGDDDTDGRDSLELQGATAASIDSGDLELSECAHLRRPSPSFAVRGDDSELYCAGSSTVGPFIRSDDSASGESAPIPGTSTQQTPTANGPRHLPGLDLYQQSSARTRLIGERLSSTDKISLSSPIYSNKVVEQRAKSQSRQSLIEIVSNKLDRVRQRKRFSLAQGSLMKKPRLSEAHVVTNRVTRRQRRKDIEEKFGKRKSIRGDQTHRIETATSISSDHDGCNWTFVFDPSGRLCYWWSSVVSIAFLYNFWVIIYRFAFQEINADNIAVWFTLDYTADLLYVLDIAFHFRTGYLEDGVLQTDPVKLRIHYTNTTTFYIDCLCLLPLDFLYLSIGFCSILRGFRLVKVYRFWAFMDRTERHTNYPNVIRATTLMHYLIALFHWNACLYYIVARSLGRSHDDWRFPKEQDGSMALQYLHALHRSLITLTTIGQPPTPVTIGEYLFVIFELMFALVLFATFLGHIANIVTNVSAARKEFQGEWLVVKLVVVELSLSFVLMTMLMMVFLLLVPG
nr:hypothetical protein BaRGS_016483 [Batillaria attramentaria]